MKSCSRTASLTVTLAAILIWPYSTLEAASAAYKCVSPEGQTEYVELPKAGYQCTQLRAASPPATEDAAETEAEPASDEAPVEPSTAPPKQAEQSQANCDIARKNLATLQSNANVVQTDAEGNKVLLSEEQKQAATLKAQKDIDYWCE